MHLQFFLPDDDVGVGRVEHFVVDRRQRVGPAVIRRLLFAIKGVACTTRGAIFRTIRRRAENVTPVDVTATAH